MVAVGLTVCTTDVCCYNNRTDIEVSQSHWKVCPSSVVFRLTQGLKGLSQHVRLHVHICVDFLVRAKECMILWAYALRIAGEGLYSPFCPHYWGAGCSRHLTHITTGHHKTRGLFGGKQLACPVLCTCGRCIWCSPCWPHQIIFSQDRLLRKETYLNLKIMTLG